MLHLGKVTSYPRFQFTLRLGKAWSYPRLHFVLQFGLCQCYGPAFRKASSSSITTMLSGKHRRRNVHAKIRDSVVITSFSIYATIRESVVVISFSFYATIRGRGIVLVFMLQWEKVTSHGTESSRDKIQHTSDIARIAFYKSALNVTNGRLFDFFIFLKMAKSRIPSIQELKRLRNKNRNKISLGVTSDQGITWENRFSDTDFRPVFNLFFT